MGAFGNAFGDGLGSVRQFTLLNQKVDESLLSDGIYLVTEEGYLMVFEDEKNNILISED